MGIEGWPRWAITAHSWWRCCSAGVVVAVARWCGDAIRALARVLIRRWHVNDEVARCSSAPPPWWVLPDAGQRRVVPRASWLGASRVFQPQNSTTRAGVEQPNDPGKIGQPSIFRAVQWDTLGYQGRNFVATGPDAAELTRPQRCAKWSRSGCTGPAERADGHRADRAVAERTRTHPRIRPRVLAIVPTTGTIGQPGGGSGEADVQRRHTAMVALQYPTCRAGSRSPVMQKSAAEWPHADRTRSTSGGRDCP